jgi:hypothetical protein
MTGRPTRILLVAAGIVGVSSDIRDYEPRLAPPAGTAAALVTGLAAAADAADGPSGASAPGPGRRTSGQRYGGASAMRTAAAPGAWADLDEGQHGSPHPAILTSLETFDGPAHPFGDGGSPQGGGPTGFGKDVGPLNFSGGGGLPGGGSGGGGGGLPGGGPPVVGEPGPAPAVPEPAAWALMIAGLGAVGAALRHRTAFSRRSAPAYGVIAVESRLRA